MIATGLRSKDAKVSLLLLNARSATIELVSSTHISKSFQAISRTEKFKDYIVAVASNTIFFVKINVSTMSIEIIGTIDTSSCQQKLNSNSSLIPDLCLDNSNLFFLAGSSTICIKHIEENLNDGRLP